jgi:hypothetical protein
LLDFYYLGDLEMRWRDIRFEKPTEADADETGEVLMQHDDGSRGCHQWKNIVHCVAWMPLSELPEPPDRIPDPPEGWRFVQKGEAFDLRYQLWDESMKEYRPRNYPRMPLTPNTVYIVPIDPSAPPEPQYRPFANAAEFVPHRDKWWRYKSMTDDQHNPPALFNNLVHCNQYWNDSFKNKVFDDGTPFGVRVDE